MTTLDRFTEAPFSRIHREQDPDSERSHGSYPFTPTSIPSYPVRPVDIGPLPDSIFSATPHDYAWQPMVNAERVVIHAPSQTVWNRHGRPFPLRPDYQPALALLAEMPFDWLDCGVMGLRIPYGKGNIVLFDIMGERGTYTERRHLLEDVAREFGILKGLGLMGTGLNLIPECSAHWSCYWDGMQETNRLLGQPLYRGLIGKLKTSPYPSQLRSPDETTTAWVKSQFFNL